MSKFEIIAKKLKLSAKDKKILLSRLTKEELENQAKILVSIDVLKAEKDEKKEV